MFRNAIFLSTAALIGLASAPAGASLAAPEQPRHAVSAPSAEAGVQLAQMGEIDIYYDKYGRQVLVDRNTGEVISVEPRRLTRQEWRRQQRQRELRRDREVFEDDPGYEDGVTIERPRLRERPRRYESEDDYSRYPDGDANEFPEAPRDRAAPELEPEKPTVVKRQPVERKPLGDAPVKRDVKPAEEPAETAAVEPDDGQTPDVATTGTATLDTLTPDASIDTPLTFASRPEVAALQVLLDRNGASPGVIDGRFGSNVDKALAAYRQLTGDNLKSTDAEGIKKRLADSGGDAFANYQITSEDAAGPYVASVPEDYGEKAKLERLSFTSVTEMLAERFHMDEAFLKALNPEANFNRPGTIIKVANFGQLVATPVTRIVADKARKQVRAFDSAGKLVAAYPATIGSADTPSPTGNHAVSRVALDPNYTYNPKINFKQGDNTQVLTIPPGPNGPVGSVWIALDKPTYGIHGTPEPSKIGKTESHGCVRLTNWDARELAKLVGSGVMVEFVD